MKFSVIIPLYNKQHYIQNTIKSALNQHYPEFEVIVVDDGSTDDSLKVACSISSDKLRIICQKNQGVSVARNTGIKAANGEYIAFLDADDEWTPNYLETISRLIEKYPGKGFYVTAYTVNMGDGINKYSSQLTSTEGVVESYWTTLSQRYDFVWTSATVISRQLVLEAGGFLPGEKNGQDLDLWVRVAKINPQIAYSSTYCATYNRKAESNVRSRVKILHAKAFIRDLEEAMDNPEHTPKELAAIRHKYNLKMTVYTFTTILSGDKQQTKAALKQWRKPFNGKIRLVRICLKIASILPNWINQLAYKIRLKIF